MEGDRQPEHQLILRQLFRKTEAFDLHSLHFIRMEIY